MDRFKITIAPRNTLFLGIMNRNILVILNESMAGAKGLLIGIGWHEIFIGKLYILEMPKESK